MQQVCDLMALQASANRNPFALLKTKCLNAVKNGFSSTVNITRLALPLLVLMGLSQREYATLDTTVHTSGNPVLAVTDTELSSTARDLTLSVINLPSDPVKKVTFNLDFEANMDPSTISVAIETDLMDLVSCSASWSVSGARLTVSLTFATPYALSAGTVMFVHIVDYTTPSMIVNELVALGGIVITDNMDGLRVAPQPSRDQDVWAPGATTVAETPVLYPTVVSEAVTVQGLAGMSGTLMVIASNGQIYHQESLMGADALRLDARAWPAGWLDVVIIGAKGKSRLMLLKQ